MEASGRGVLAAQHDAWKRSDLNQRQYCEVHGLPQKAFENWRQKFRAEPQPLERRLLYRRRPLSPVLSPRLVLHLVWGLMGNVISQVP
jgi:hypothetical protein